MSRFLSIVFLIIGFALFLTSENASAWKLACEIESDGRVIYGNVSSLTDKVLSGQDMRVTIYRVNHEVNIPCDTLSYHTITKSAHCQSYVDISSETNLLELDKYFRWQQDLYHLFFVVNSNGIVDMSRWKYGEHTPKEHTKERYRAKWFYDDNCSKIYETNKQGDVLYGSMTDLLESVKKGGRLRALIHRDDQPAGSAIVLASFCDEIIYDAHAGTVCCKFAPVISAPVDVQNNQSLIYSGDIYHLFHIINNNGYVDMTRWRWGEHTFLNRNGGLFRIQWLASSFTIETEETINGSSINVNCEGSGFSTGFIVSLVVNGVLSLPAALAASYKLYKHCR